MLITLSVCRGWVTPARAVPPSDVRKRVLECVVLSWMRSQSASLTLPCLCPSTRTDAARPPPLQTH